MRAFLLLLLTLAAAPVAAEERITRFASEIRVEPDASLTVAEEITVIAEGREIRHGILRDFPTTYTDRYGGRVRVGFELLTVERDGRPEPHLLEPLENGRRIRIGSAELRLPPGQHRYRIRYRTTRQLGFFPAFDEFYWNVTGNRWTLPIEQATASIQLPGNARVLQHAFYTGPQGAQGRDARVAEERQGRILFATTRRLGPGEGLTVAVAWPKGLVQPPSRERQLAWLVTDNAGPLLAAIGTALVLAYYLLAWTRVGRDPAGGTIVPLFAPPDGISPPAARYATAMKFDHRAFAAGILSLAVKGRLRIEDTDGGYRLVQCPASTPALTEAESRLHGSLFRQGPSLDLVRSNRTRIQAARKSLRQAFEHELGGPVFRTNRGWLIGGIVLSALVLIGVLLLLQREVAQDQLAGFGLSAGCAAGFVLFLVLQSARRWWEERSFGSFFRLLALSTLLALLAGLGFLLLTWAGSWRFLAVAVAAPLLVALGFTFYHLLKAPTPAGRRLLDQLRGFRHYLEVAEEHRLGILHPPERTPELFERYLPFALALGVEHAWSQKFAGALGRSAAERDTGPSWYKGDRWDADRPGHFTDRVGSSLAAATASAAAAPGSSSGSGGGGSSGGGGGGGGGSGW